MSRGAPDRTPLPLPPGTGFPPSPRHRAAGGPSTPEQREREAASRALAGQTPRPPCPPLPEPAGQPPCPPAAQAAAPLLAREQGAAVEEGTPPPPPDAFSGGGCEPSPRHPGSPGVCMAKALPRSSRGRGSLGCALSLKGDTRRGNGSCRAPLPCSTCPGPAHTHPPTRGATEGPGAGGDTAADTAQRARADAARGSGGSPAPPAGSSRGNFLPAGTSRSRALQL